MDFNCQIPRFKRVYSLRIKQELKKMGFEPVTEADNIQKRFYILQPYFCRACRAAHNSAGI